MKIEWKEGESKVTSLDPGDLDSLTDVLSEIGARISDVVAADNVIWVEGQSEEDVFPLVLRTLAKRKMFGTAFVALYDTGGFSRKHLSPATISRLYQKLSEGGGLVPRAIGFSFDREGRSDGEIEELRTKYPNIHFLPRRMFENYLIDDEALAHVISLQLEPAGRVMPEAVVQWLKDRGTENRYFNPLPIQKVMFSEKWYETVHAGKLIEDLFQEISESKAQFVKTRDDAAIVKWLLEHRPTNLQPLCVYIENVINKCAASTTPVLEEKGNIN